MRDYQKLIIETPFKDDNIKQTYWQYIVKITDDKRDRTTELLRLLDVHKIPTLIHHYVTNKKSTKTI